MSDDQAREMRPETTSEHIARDMREGRFPEQSERQMVPVLASLPHEIQVWRSMDTLDHIGTWSTTRYPPEAVTYVPKSDAAAAVALALEEAAKALDERGQQEQVNFGLDRCTQNFYRARNIVRAIAPASGVAKLEALRAERDEWRAVSETLSEMQAGEYKRAEQLAAELAAANAREAGLRDALEVIREWTAFPPTGRFWRNGDGTISARPMPYGAAFGSNGERDFMRQVARAALAQPSTEGGA